MFVEIINKVCYPIYQMPEEVKGVWIVEKRRLLIVDCSEDFLLALSQELEQDYYVRCCTDGSEALATILEFQPHLMILELILPGLDGISLLEAAAAEVQLPVSITITPFYNDYSLQAIGRLNVGYAMRKPCQIHAVADRLRDLDRQSAARIFPGADPVLIISETLLSLGFVPKHLGYAYLQQAIVSIAQNPEQSFTKELYPAIAAEYNCEQSSVEHAIRTSITCAWEKGDSALWLRYFPQGTCKTGSRPTNSTFINRLAGELRLKK